MNQKLIEHFQIPMKPITKKNSQEIRRNRKTGRPFICQSQQYQEYEASAGWFVPKRQQPIDYRVNIQATFYMPTRGTVDLTNLNSSLHDILVKFGMLKTDCWKVAAGTDGSRVKFDKEKPRTVVVITKMEDDE